MYGAVEFLRQGIREHGIEMVNAVFALTDVAVLRVNPAFVPVCAGCEKVPQRDDGCITYEGDTYAGCSYCAQPM